MFSEAAIKNTMSGTVACMRAAGIKITAASLVERNTLRAAPERPGAVHGRACGSESPLIFKPLEPTESSDSIF